MQICHISIPRWFQFTEKEITLHGFSDASESAYACVIYAVQRNDNGVTKVAILAAKSKVASRLELNGALLLTRLFSVFISTLKDHVIKFYTWTDSQVVLSWLSSPPRNWKPLIANKTSEILDCIPQNRWRYVPNKENPADIGSRGVSPKDLPDCRLWWEGPSFLSSLEVDWPKQPVLKTMIKFSKREKKPYIFSVSLKNDIID
ncbi:uncharacterized protein NPIL_420711 [Nephila pilipes]|uniref:Uncharacterized protein n=1 Tax=Nephila pilipes TaxID=299642 RepID=A0A8X6QEA7_NEPPI|nr:uncharacterized protein NPIL_420711 [Nephila pilipes]